MAQQIQFIYLTQSDYNNLTPQTNKIYFTSDTKRIYKGSDLYAATTFDQLNFSAIQASSITVNGSAVSLEGHSHSMSDIDGLDSAITAATSSFALTGHTHVVSEITDFDATAFASSNHTHPELSGLTSSTITKDTGTFTNLVVASASFTATNVEAEEISASTATFGDINVTGTASLSATHVSASTLTADTGTFTNLTVGGSTVALVGHTHPASEVTGLQSVLDGLSSTYASISHVHAISDITNLSTILTGITESDIEKDTVTADIGYFRLLSVSGSANFAVNTVSANAVTVNGTDVALSGHTHSVSEVTGLSAIVSGITSSSIEKENGQFVNLNATNLSVSQLTVDATVVSANSMTVGGSNVSVEGHTHVISEITDLDTTAFASSTHTHSELAGITSSTIDKDSGNFVTLSASTATFETMTVSGSATFDITNLVADAITVSDLNLTGTLSISSTAISTMTVTDMSVTGTLTLNSKSIATQEYVQLMISQAIGQILASAY